jgi:hypothetical protein
VLQLSSVVVQAEAAHLCYLVAGVLPQVYEPGARMCLLGADHRGAPHTLASVAALQRTEILEWAKLPGATSTIAASLQELLPLLLCDDVASDSSPAHEQHAIVRQYTLFWHAKSPYGELYLPWQGSYTGEL